LIILKKIRANAIDGFTVSSLQRKDVDDDDDNTILIIAIAAFMHQVTPQFSWIIIAQYLARACVDLVRPTLHNNPIKV
jgi:hypothetical protein